MDENNIFNLPNMGLEEIVNKDKLEVGETNIGEMEFDKISDVTNATYVKGLFNEDIVDDMSSIKDEELIKSRESSYDSESSSDSREEDTSEDLFIDASEDLFREEKYSDEPEFENSVEEKFTKQESSKPQPNIKKRSSAHNKIIYEINLCVKNMKSEDIEVPQYNKNKIKKDPRYAAETLSMLKRTFDIEDISSMSMTVIHNCVKYVPVLFDGKRQVLGKRLPNMKGYDTSVQLKSSQLRRETDKVANNVRGKFGESSMSALRLANIFVIPLFTTFTKNNVSLPMNKLSPEELDDYSDESESESESDEVDF